MAGTRASPLTMAFAGTDKAGSRLPSTNTHAGVSLRFCTARLMARKVACRMLTSSISCDEAQATSTHKALAQISS